MPTVEDHKEAALVVLSRLAQPDIEPQLDGTELDAILNNVQRASFWLPATAFAIDDVVLPATKNGHRFICVQAGTTAATEPEWPKREASTITDGNDVIWQEAGADFDNVFDIRAAAHEAWLIKAGKASQLYNVRTGSTSRDQSQLYQHCIDMAERIDAIKFA